MEKETLQKVYKLKQVRPDKSWVASTRKDIVGEDISFADLLVRPGMAFCGGLAVVLLVGVIHFGDDRHIDYPIPDIDTARMTIEENNERRLAEAQEEEEKEEEEVQEEEAMIAMQEDNEDLISEIDEISRDLNELSSTLGELNKQTLETYVLTNLITDEELDDIDDKRIAEELLFELERKYTEKEEDKERVEEARERFDEGDYERVFYLYTLIARN